MAKSQPDLAFGGAEHERWLRGLLSEMKKNDGKVAAATLVGKPWEWLFDLEAVRVRELCAGLGRPELADSFVQKLERSSVLRGLIESGSESDHFAYSAAIGALQNVLIDPWREMLEQRGELVKSWSDRAEELRAEARTHRRSAEALRNRGKADLADQLEAEADRLGRGVIEPERSGAPRTTKGSLACELEQMLEIAHEIPVGRRREIIAGLIREFLDESATAESVRSLLRDARRFDEERLDGPVRTLYRGPNSVSKPGSPAPPSAETFPEPIAHPGRFAGVRVAKIDLE